MLSTDVLCYDSATGRIALFASDGSYTLQAPAALTATWEPNLIIVPGKFIGSSGATAQGVYSDLLIFNRATGMAQFYSTDGNGNRVPFGPLAAHTWTHIVAGIFTPDGSFTDLLCYDQNTGVAQFYSTDGAGNLKLLLAHPFSHWTHLVPGFFRPNVQTMDILFYDALSGNAAFYSVWNGAITLIKSYTGWPLTWALIVAGTFRTASSTDDLLFYDPSRGQVSFQSTDGLGGIALINVANWSVDLSNIVAGYFWHEMTCTGLLVYSQSRDTEQMQSVWGQANVSARGSIAGFGGWTDIIAAKFLNSQLESWHNFDEPSLTRVEAYASSDSVAPGQTIDICIEAERSYRGHYFFQFSLSVTRSGISDFTFEATGVARPQQTPPNPSIVGCGWRPSVTIPIPGNCGSGVYFATISVGGLSTLIPFVVRPGVRKSRILLAIATPTMQAYNGWGGQSLYDGYPAGSTRGPVVSYDRPHSVDSDPALVDKRLGILSVDLIRWLEINNGFAIDYCTQVDLHFGTVDLSAYSLLIFHWHSEYWSFEMRTNVEAFLTAGGNVAFLCGNTCWWQIRLDETGRLVTCYKYVPGPTGDPSGDAANGAPTDDPFAASSDPNQVKRSTIYWWDDRVYRPEILFTGLTFRYGWAVNHNWPPTPAQGYTVAQAKSWVFDGTGLSAGDVFGQESPIIGSEVDSALGQDHGRKFGNIYWGLAYQNSPLGFIELAYCNLYIVPNWDGDPAVNLTITGASSNTVQVDTTSGFTRGYLVQGSVNSQIQSVDSSTNTLSLLDSGLAWQVGQGAVVSRSFGWASMGIFRYAEAGTVFNAGTMRWTLGLDPLNATVVSRITINVLRSLSTKSRVLPWLSLLL